MLSGSVVKWCGALALSQVERARLVAARPSLSVSIIRGVSRGGVDFGSALAPVVGLEGWAGAPVDAGGWGGITGALGGDPELRAALAQQEASPANLAQCRVGRMRREGER